MHPQLELWPAIIHYNGIDELEIVKNQSEWDNVKQTGFRTGDRLITTNGTVCELSSGDNDDLLISDTGCLITTEEAVTLARSHIAALEQCCVSKFNARSVQGVIDALIALEKST